MASLLLYMNMAAQLFRRTPEEALAGVTRTPAAALSEWKMPGMNAGACAHRSCDLDIDNRPNWLPHRIQTRCGKRTLEGDL